MYNELIKVTFNENLIVISEFLDGTITSFDMKKMIKKYPIINKLKEDDVLYKNGYISPGGYAVIWNDEIDFDAESLYYDGTILEKKPIDINKSIAILVTMARFNKGISQKELSKITKIHQAEISKIERGIGNPSIKTLDRIAKGLGLKLELFLK